LQYETLLLNNRDGAGIITLNRPEKLNALSTTLFAEFDRALNVFEDDESVRVLVVTGAGERAFSAGADIHEMTEMSPEQARQRDAQRTDWTWHLAAYRKPTIGVINGLAYGGGALMSSIFDIRIGCERTSFRFLAASYGRVNSSWTLPLVVGWPVAKELLFTGRLVEAEEAYRIGLLNRLVPSAQLMTTALEISRMIASNDAAAVQALREIMVRDIGMTWREMQHNEAELVARMVKSPPAAESFSDFLGRKKKKSKSGEGRE